MERHLSLDIRCSDQDDLLNQYQVSTNFSPSLFSFLDLTKKSTHTWILIQTQSKKYYCLEETDLTIEMREFSSWKEADDKGKSSCQEMWGKFGKKNEIYPKNTNGGSKMRDVVTFLTKMNRNSSILWKKETSMGQEFMKKF